MDYEQDYSKLAPTDNHWYNRRVRFTPVFANGDEETSSSQTLTLDNEDFN